MPCLAFLLLGTLAAARHDRTVEGKVVRVTDGDTLEIFKGRKTYRIRLAEVDCPEKKQPFGSRAKQFTSQMVFGKQVRAVVQTKDRYGRLVAEVLLADGRSVNRELVRAGMAWWYRHYSKDSSYQTLEAEARDARRGLWADSNPAPPWEFRKAKRSRGKRD